MNRNKIYEITIKKADENYVYFYVATTATKAKSGMVNEALFQDCTYIDICARVLRGGKSCYWEDTYEDETTRVGFDVINTKGILYVDLPLGEIYPEDLVKYLKSKNQINYWGDIPV